MRILFNRRPVYGPWGGGSKVLRSIIEECNKRKHSVNFEEEISNHKDIDILFCADPRQGALSYNDLVRYREKYSKAKIIQRVGDLGTHGKPELFDLVKQTTAKSDIVIFPSKWAKDFLNYSGNSVIIQNAPHKDFCAGKILKRDKRFTRLVTHHWSDNAMKGFSTYKRLDEFCSLNSEYSFTYIGRKPNDITLTNYIKPLDIAGLVEELPRHDVYVTASFDETGANHVLEAIALGLPVLYNARGGSINEYCKNHGICYEDFDDLINILTEKFQDTLTTTRDRMIPLTRTIEDMAKEYVDLLESVTIC